MAEIPDCKKDNQLDGGLLSQFTSYFHGGTSGTLTTLLVFPVYKTINRQQIHNSTIRQAVAQLKMEGLPKLYRGVVPPLLQRTLNSTVLFGVHETFLQKLTLSSRAAFPSHTMSALAGLATGVVEAVFFTPIERVQNLLQNSQNDMKLPTLRRVLFELNNQKLASGYYRAFVPMMVRNTLGSALYFGMKGPIYDAVQAQGLPPVVASFTSGTLASWPITFLVYPISTLVANMQKRLEGEGSGVRACWRVLWEDRQRSVLQLYRGGSLTVLRSCISWGVTTALYDWQKSRQAKPKGIL
ncbi:solute carrier family 25 member 53 [Takifugu rubripes]|uniref:Solute carrier family 25 member 53 n=1 Tax=Takifugu rubripes TaxID=31033 RepID=H2TM19_TAKRU|nr:solute carrier family 25 member 53 [Takifugu rubripes]|eukprot:XP_003970536.1 PREDICTED: solute carrier family 25 member 53 [Takifugu rubripes]